MTKMSIHPIRAKIAIHPVPPSESTMARLAEILTEVVAANGSVHFMDPIPHGKAEAYWRDAFEGAKAGDRLVLGAFLETILAGTVTLFLGTPPNQPFRAEIWKLMVAPVYRRMGLGRALVSEAESLAREHGRTLLTLDTAVEGGASELYEGLGWTRVGVIPDYAFKPKGGVVGTAIYYKKTA
ncbi:MAG TPA: GNAT family N-acetyltransferase [Caulobacteraceae bacterium]|jgi:ribosomal protein S18 acetylase RimI-like enzyme|nr:GNAT family N-acetyltransferase [Caulobacteraceae bacterium]